MTCHKESCHCGDKVEEVGQKLKDLAQRFHDDPEGTAHQVGKELRVLLDSAGDELRDAGKTVTTKIHQKPVESSLVALGIGALLGLLLGRR